MSAEKIQGCEEWGRHYRAGIGNRYPDENLVRLLSGRYVPLPQSGRALDVGFGRGSNLVLLAQKGFEAYGLEISQESIDAAETLAKEAGVKLNLGLLQDTQLPYPDAFFDLLVSWGAVYYFGNRTLVAKALEEFYRVLKPGGALILLVLHPNSSTSKRLSRDLGDGAHEIEQVSSYDSRKGLKIFYDATSSGWKELLRGYESIEEGTIEFDLFVPERRDAWRLFLARKGAQSGM